jgi:hypothetical protein
MLNNMDGIKEVFDKISSYNIFNYLYPGILFSVICKSGIGVDFMLENNFLGVFLYYFIGMIISRIGSVFIEPILKWIKFLKFSEYKKFVQASKSDSKIELLSEVNNTYRTIISMFSILIFLKTYKHFNYFYWHIPHEVSYSMILIFLLILFLLSYRKQTNYITNRINSVLNP